MSWRASRASELLMRAFEAGESDASDPLGLFRRVALVADSEGDGLTAMRARRWMVGRAPWADADFDLVVAFAWLFKRSEKDPDLVDPQGLMWEYKWVVKHLMTLACIPMVLVDRAIEDLERRYINFGLSTAAAVQLRLDAALEMRRKDVLPERFEAWLQNESGAGSDCAACRRNLRVHYFAAIGDSTRTIAEARPILDGEMACADIPKATYPAVVESQLRLGLFEEAQKTCARGVKALDDGCITKAVGSHLVCHAVTGELDAGLELAGRWLRFALRTRDHMKQYNYYRGASLVLRAAQSASVDSVYLVLPPDFELFEPDGLYEVESLGACFDTRAEALAERFDQRHGNQGLGEELAHDRALLLSAGL